MRRSLGLVAMLLVVLTICSCSAGRKTQSNAENPAALQTEAPAQTDEGGKEAYAVTFVDALGHTVTVQKTDTVVALMGSFAEMWLTAGGRLAGVTEDAYSERGLTLESDVALLGSYKNPSVESVIALNPDLVLLSADTDEHVALYETLRDAGVNPAYFSVKLFQEYLDTLALFTQMTGRPDLYEKNGLDIKARIDAAIARKEGHTPPSVLFIRAFSTGYRALGSDSMTGAMLHDLGADNIADRVPSLLEELSMEAIIAADPSYIFVVTMGADSDKALEALHDGLQTNPAWEGLSAVKAGRYCLLPRELFHYKPNARWGESYEYLADILYGE